MAVAQIFGQAKCFFYKIAFSLPKNLGGYH